MKKLLSLLLTICLCLSFSFVACDESDNTPPQNEPPKNVILVIGDGMGDNHIRNAVTYYDLSKPAFYNDKKCVIGTNSLDGTTDSAAGGTALATGNKVHNSNLAMLNGDNLEQITTIAKSYGMKTGVITTDVLSGATPSAFSAHSTSRDNTSTIMQTQAVSGVDLLIGRASSDYTNNKSLYTSNGYTFASNKEELLSNKSANKLVGAISNIDSEYISGNETDYQLKDMAKFAVEYLENETGFFLMIEGAYIDKHSHNNDIDKTMAETRSLIDTISYLYNYANDGKTAIFITADHETGGLQRTSNKDDITSWLFTSVNHTPVDVPLFIKNYSFDITKFGYQATDRPENTVVFSACKDIIQTRFS
ncbi:MAG: alkaline phosphatase [Clostridia bacterium]|nr:alkaline phosphatase [Clostridia bacterium]